MSEQTDRQFVEAVTKFRNEKGPRSIVQITEEQVLKAVYESGLHQRAPKVLKTSWKDDIDIDEPSGALMNFVGKILNT